ncbi:N-acetyl-D-Glu racemase DgcA [Steroidobacter sp.]|uniref:N-acetyl-D-Glu racemase DgcA n=1 Tax=Steroidobacter sp. TaxID=1978227 RepID=UPI001A5AF49F|nr:N-acetyl-D-Glu racemase DgcA [Steroidobacter sp.]MBL8269107.1 dipeptide epimerase [Steroidobacter sp.]
MLSGFIARSERWPLARPFRISRGVKTEAVVTVVEARVGDIVGRGESVPYARYNETPESVLQQLEVLKSLSPFELTRARLETLLPAGAARNAVDCALWDLEARTSGKSVAQLIGQSVPASYSTAVTISIDTPENMAAAARDVASSKVIKIKVDDQTPQAAIEAVASVAPDAQLIIDPNESWNIDLLRELQPFLAKHRIAFIEQPLPGSQDAALETFTPLVPLCADESVHTVSGLEQIARRYQVVNIKLDKTGGLTEALRLRQAARDRKLQVMIGCMVCTSLSIAPALQIAAHADYADLDGPWWLAKDRDQGVLIDKGQLTLSQPFLWGNQ